MFSLAILLFVRGETRSFLTAGLAVGAFTLAGALCSPLLGTLVDRIGQPRVLFPAAAAQGSLLVLFVVLVRAGAPAFAIVALAALAGALLPPISGCIRALWPVVAPDPESLESIYALDAITQEVIYSSGPLLVGATAVLASPAVAVLLCAAVAVGGTLYFAASPLSRDWRGESVQRSRGGALASPGLRTLLVSAVFGGMVVGAAEVGLPALAVHLGSRGAAGVLLALFSLGSMAGGILYAAHSWNASMGRRYMLILLAVEFSMAPLLGVNSLALGLLCSAIAGLGVAAMLSCQFSLVGSLAPAGTTTEAFTWHRAATVGGIAGGSALGGALVDAIGTGGAFALGCTGAAVACLFAALGLGSIEPAAVPDYGAALAGGVTVTGASEGGLGSSSA